MEPPGALTLPLFPLGVVVFPDQTLPLHIFEERYKQMIADCAPSETGGEYAPFGISFEHEGSVAPVGCAVQVLRVTRRYQNGTFDLVCRGIWRFRAAEVRQNERPYLVADVERFDDEDPSPPDPSLSLAVRERLQRLMDLATQDMGRLGYGPQTEGLEATLDDIDDGDTFTLAQRIGLEPTHRQKLLTLRSEDARLRYLADFLDELLPAMKTRQDRQRRVKTNGHSRHESGPSQREPGETAD